ncbi:hypothetical protein Vafri_7876, partial [Volvox africanus]
RRWGQIYMGLTSVVGGYICILFQQAYNFLEPLLSSISFLQQLYFKAKQLQVTPPSGKTVGSSCARFITAEGGKAVGRMLISLISHQQHMDQVFPQEFDCARCVHGGNGVG